MWLNTYAYFFELVLLKSWGINYFLGYFLLFKKKPFTRSLMIYQSTGNLLLSAIRQKGNFKAGVTKKTKQAKFFRETNISYPLIRTRTCTYQEVRKFRFTGKFGLLCFLVTPVLKFTLLSYYHRYTRHCKEKKLLTCKESGLPKPKCLNVNINYKCMQPIRPYDCYIVERPFCSSHVETVNITMTGTFKKRRISTNIA